MKPNRIPLIIGLLLALGTGVLLLNFLSSLRTRTIVQSKLVWVAAHDIPARIRIDGDALTQVSRSGPDLDPDAITDKKDIVGRYTLITVPVGSVLTASKVGEISSLALPARLPVGMRAISIAIDPVKGVAGLIQPGDHVDVIAVPPRAGIETPIGSTILRGALVLAVGNETETAQASPNPGNQNLTTVTLAVTPAQADILASADINTVLRLTLRSPSEPVKAFPVEPLQLGIPSQSTVQPQEQLQAQAPAMNTMPVAPAPSATSAPQSGVVLIDGDRIVPRADQEK